MPRGKLFFNRNDGSGGRFGHIDQHQKWCVNFKGVSFHIDSHLSGFTESTLEVDRLKRKTIVTFCDGSCEKAAEIPSEIWDEAKTQFATFQQVAETEDVSRPDATQEQPDFINLAGHYYGA
jgi:hypothetical protein